MTSAASSARTCKMRVLMAPHFYFLNLSIVVPADGIKAAKLRKRRLRYVTVLWGSHQSSDCLTVSLGSWSADRESQYRVGKLAVFFAAGGGNRLRPSLRQSPVAQDGMKLPIRPSRVPLWVKGCLRDYVCITTAVPPIADDLLQCPSRQSRASCGHSGRAAIFALGPVSGGGLLG